MDISYKGSLWSICVLCSTGMTNTVHQIAEVTEQLDCITIIITYKQKSVPNVHRNLSQFAML